MARDSGGDAWTSPGFSSRSRPGFLSSLRDLTGDDRVRSAESLG